MLSTELAEETWAQQCRVIGLKQGIQHYGARSQLKWTRHGSLDLENEGLLEGVKDMKEMFAGGGNATV
jgi:hypothetical protein